MSPKIISKKIVNVLSDMDRVQQHLKNRGDDRLIDNFSDGMIELVHLTKKLYKAVLKSGEPVTLLKQVLYLYGQLKGAVSDNELPDSMLTTAIQIHNEIRFGIEKQAAMLCKDCTGIAKQAGYFSLKQLMTQEGVHVEHPVFHSTSYENAAAILTEGFRARAGGKGNDAYEDNSICFTRNLCFSEKERYGFGSGQVILVLDLNKLKTRFKTYQVDWHSKNINPLTNKKLTDEDREKLKAHQKRHSDSEYEERVSISPRQTRDTSEPETVIPPKYIEAVIIKKGGGGARLWQKFGEHKLFLTRTDKDKYSLVQKQVDTQDIHADLTQACMQNDFTEVEFALSGLNTGHLPNAGYKFTEEDRDYFVNLAVSYNSYEALEVLLKHAFLNANNSYPLRKASEMGFYSMVELLIDRGADATSNYSQALRMACENRRYDIIMLLIEHGADIHIHHELPLYFAVKNGNASLIKFLLEKGASPQRLVADIIKEDDSLKQVILSSKGILSLFTKYGLTPDLMKELING